MSKVTKIALMGWLVTLSAFTCLYLADSLWWIHHAYDIANVLGVIMVILLGVSAMLFGALVQVWASAKWPKQSKDEKIETA